MLQANLGAAGILAIATYFAADWTLQGVLGRSLGGAMFGNTS
jgi:hypothetical protein